MTVVMRGKSTRIYAVLMGVAAVAILIGSGINGGMGEILWVAPILLAIAAIGWAVFWNPRLEVGPSGLRVINIFREWLVPWADLNFVENRWGLYIDTHSGKRISVWGLPSRTGLMQNSWRDRKRQVEEEIVWTMEEMRVERVVPLPFAADTITLRARDIRSDAYLRRDLARIGPDWGETTKMNIMPIPVIAVIVTVLAAAFTFMS